MALSEKAQKQTEQLWQWINDTKPGQFVFFGGAGVSTESGIPDFRSADGLYRQTYGNIPPEEMISRTFFDAYPQTFFRFYFDRMIVNSAQPNRAHITLAALERQGLLGGIVTQNIDGLHQAAGSNRVYEVHGSVLRNHCMQCHSAYDLTKTIALHEQATDGVPRCPHCGGIIKPDVVLYEEPLDTATMEAAVTAIAHADLLLIAGTSLVVYPAAGFIDCFSGKHLVIVNTSTTPRDAAADLCIQASIGDVLDPAFLATC